MCKFLEVMNLKKRWKCCTNVIHITISTPCWFTVFEVFLPIQIVEATRYWRAEEIYCNSFAQSCTQILPVHQLWSKDDGRPIFNAIFARNMFQETLRMMRFDNAGVRRQNRSLNKLQPIRETFDLGYSTLQDSFTSCANLNVDEQLLSFRGLYPSRQNLPSKPEK